MADVMETNGYAETPLSTVTSPEGYYRRPLVRVSKGPRTTLFNGHFPGIGSIAGARNDIREYGIDTNIYLKSVRWVQLFSWKNRADSTQKYTFEYSSGITTTQGSETTVGFEASAAFKGLGIGFSYSTKTFNSTEISKGTKITREITVDANAEVFFYQKQYEFVSEHLYAIDNTYDSGGGIYVSDKGVPLKTYSVQLINADEFYTSKKVLTGQAVITPATVAYKVRGFWNWDVLDQFAKSAFDSMFEPNRPYMTPPS